MQWTYLNAAGERFEEHVHLRIFCQNIGKKTVEKGIMDANFFGKGEMVAAVAQEV